MARPRIAIVPTGGTIQNGQPLVTSAKAGGPLALLRAQRLYESVSVRIAKEDADGNPLPLTPGVEPFWTADLDPADGLYLLPYMEPGHEPPNDYASAHLSGRRVIEEIDRLSLDTTGRNNLLASIAELVVVQVIDPDTGKELRAGGETFGVRELVLVANTVSAALAREDIAGCVVTHGTFTVEETACFLNYAVDSDKPIVVAASQRRHGSIGNDGDWNLWDAVRVASNPAARGMGAMLVMDEQILPAREVTKTNQRPGGFAASGGSAGALGSVESDQVTFYFQPLRRHTSKSQVKATSPLPLSLPRVDIVKTYAGADSIPIDALVQRALRDRSTSSAPQQHGIVVEGFAYSGAPHRYQRPALEAAVHEQGIPVVLANRGDHGRIPRPGSSPFITADNLMAVKARLLLMLAIRTLGLPTPFRNPAVPTEPERERLAAEIQRYQVIFDTH
ncbi:MAG: asparaginase domain-containing protein [Chloroflexi bacterium]|nr:asparaginase domain-containing protein [Chloroflexota bacterium]